SATRGVGSAGVVAAARAFMRDLDLARFGRAGPDFSAELDLATIELVGALPKKAASWGLARKLLNIFLRDSFYTTYLCAAFGLDRAEQCYEVPLESVTATELKKSPSGRKLPPWPGVRNVPPELSSLYQSA